MREPQNMFVGLAAMLVTLLVGGCKSAPLGAPPVKDDRIGSVKDITDSQAGHVQKALDGVDKALKQLQ